MGIWKKDVETTALQDAARIALGATLVLAGTSHLTFARKPFRAQFRRGCRWIRTMLWWDRA